MALKNAGYIYPAIYPNESDTKQQIVVDALRTRNVNALRGLRGVLENGHSLLLSTEGLTNQLFLFDSRTRETFREAFHGFATDIILLTRDATAWIRSFHAQGAHNPPTPYQPLHGHALSLTQLQQLPLVKKPTDEVTLRNRLQDIFCHEALHSFRHQSHFLQNIATLLGLDFGAKIEPKRLNTSAPDWMIDIVCRLNRHPLVPKDRSIVLELLRSSAKLESLLDSSNRQGNTDPNELSSFIASVVIRLPFNKTLYDLITKIVNDLSTTSIHPQSVTRQCLTQTLTVWAESCSTPMPELPLRR